MGYYIDLEKLSIDDCQIKLGSAYLPPRKMILKDKLDERFGYHAGFSRFSRDCALPKFSYPEDRNVARNPA